MLLRENDRAGANNVEEHGVGQEWARADVEVLQVREDPHGCHQSAGSGVVGGAQRPSRVRERWQCGERAQRRRHWESFRRQRRRFHCTLPAPPPLSVVVATSTTGAATTMATIGAIVQEGVGAVVEMEPL